MQKLTCPIPENINPIQNSGFNFSILKLPEIQYFCQEVNLPSLSISAAEGYVTPLVNIMHPGDKITFETLEVQFMIDEGFVNYTAIYNWIIGLGFPESHSQFADFITKNTSGVSNTPTLASVSDAMLHILSPSGKIVKSIRFIDVFPVSLSSVTLSSTTSDVSYIVGTSSFAYTYYKFE
jgi:hypothetical protein